MSRLDLDWNVLLTSRKDEERALLKEVKELGIFRRTDFKGILVGKVKDVEKFMEEISRRMPYSLSRVIPIEEAFPVSVERLMETLRSRIERYADRINPGETFCIKFERRGFRGRISSMDVEMELGAHLSALLSRTGKDPKVELRDPDKLISIQMIGNLCGIGIIAKATRAKYSFVRAK